MLPTPRLPWRSAVRRLASFSPLPVFLGPALLGLAACQSGTPQPGLSASAGPARASAVVWSPTAATRAERRTAYAEATLRRARGDLDGARESLGRALALDPDSALLRRDLGELWLMEGRADEARVLLAEARALDPETSLGLAELSEACRRSGHMEEAVDVLLELLRRRPDLDGTYYQVHALLLLAGATQRGLETFEAVVERRPGWAFGFEALGDFRLRAGLPDEAQECYVRAVAVGGPTEGLARKLKLAHMRSLSLAIDALHESTARSADPGLVLPAPAGIAPGAR